MSSDKRKEELDREVLFQRRIAQLGFQRQQLPWNMSEKPQFNLPVEETKLYAERELESAITEEESERRVLMDLLSQTYNFRTFYKRLHYELKRARRYKRSLSIVLVAIDRLEVISRQFGPDTADASVQATARVLLNSIRDVDIPGRCREDTFGVILPETGLEGAEVAAERIRTKLEQFSVRTQWQSITITVSVGAACFPETSTQLDEMFAQAAEALLSSMQKGGNGVIFAPRQPSAAGGGQ